MRSRLRLRKTTGRTGRPQMAMIGCAACLLLNTSTEQTVGPGRRRLRRAACHRGRNRQEREPITIRSACQVAACFCTAWLRLPSNTAVPVASPAARRISAARPVNSRALARRPSQTVSRLPAASNHSSAADGGILGTADTTQIVVPSCHRRRATASTALADRTE